MNFTKEVAFRQPFSRTLEFPTSRTPVWVEPSAVLNVQSDLQYNNSAQKVKGKFSEKMAEECKTGTV